MITLKQLQEIGAALPPERRNPAPGDVCLYTAPAGDHCIIGEVMSKIGLEVPMCSESDNRVAVAWLAKEGRWAGRLEDLAMVWAGIAQVFGQMGYPWAACVMVANNSVAPRVVIPGVTDDDGRMLPGSCARPPAPPCQPPPKTCK